MHRPSPSTAPVSPPLSRHSCSAPRAVDDPAPVNRDSAQIPWSSWCDYVTQCGYSLTQRRSGARFFVLKRPTHWGEQEARLLSTQKDVIDYLHQEAAAHLKTDWVMRLDANYAVTYGSYDCYWLLMGLSPTGEAPDGLTDAFRAHAQHCQSAEHRFATMNAADLPLASALCREFESGDLRRSLQRHLDLARAEHEAQAVAAAMPEALDPPRRHRL